MMKGLDLSQLTLEELKAEKKRQSKIMTKVLILLIIASGALAFFGALYENFVFVTIAPACIVIALPLMMRVGQLNKEIERRNLINRDR